MCCCTCSLFRGKLSTLPTTYLPTYPAHGHTLNHPSNKWWVLIKRETYCCTVPYTNQPTTGKMGVSYGKVSGWMEMTGNEDDNRQDPKKCAKQPIYLPTYLGRVALLVISSIGNIMMVHISYPWLWCERNRVSWFANVWFRKFSVSEGQSRQGKKTHISLHAHLLCVWIEWSWGGRKGAEEVVWDLGVGGGFFFGWFAIVMCR